MFQDEPVSHLMTRDVHTVELSTPISAVRRLLDHNPFQHVPVLKKGKLVGMITATDLSPLTLRAYVDDEETVDAYLDARFTVADVMSTDLQTVGVTDDIGRAAELLARGQFHAVPVVEHDGTLVGILTTTDLIRGFLTR